MKNIEYIRSLSAEELGRFLRNLRRCGESGNCSQDCPWRAYWTMKDLKSMEYSKMETFSRFECPALTTKWLTEEIKPELHIFET